MEATSRPHTEITPHVLTAAEVQLLHCARTGLEPLGASTSQWLKTKKKKNIARCCVFSVDETEVHLIWILTGDPRSYDMPSRTWNAVRGVKVDNGVTPRTLSIKHTDVLNSVKWDAHCNLSEIKQIFKHSSGRV